MIKLYHTVIRIVYKKDGLLREKYIRLEDDYYESANYFEDHYVDHYNYPDYEEAVVINQFVTEESEDE